MTHELQAQSAAGQAAVAQVTSVPHLDGQGNVLGLVVLSLDVTQQRRAEKELRTQQEKLDLILDSVPGHVVYFDSDFHVLHVNRVLAEWLGYSKEDIQGRAYKEVARPGGYEYNMP